MFGERLDYRLLRALAHPGNRATEAELEAQQFSPLKHPQAAEHKLAKILRRFQGRVPVDAGLRYLDMGCGTGEVTVGFARLGVRRITGVDLLARSVAVAKRNAALAGVGDRVDFRCEDLLRWQPEEKFDVLLSFDALEHVADPARFLRRMADFLAPGGIAVVAFGPLFHSPFGDHMGEFFRWQLPWRGVLFNEDALMRVRREFYRPTDAARRYREVAGGLNLMRYSEFRRHLRAAGWQPSFLRVNAFFAGGPLDGLCQAVGAVPLLQDYLIHNVYAVLRHAKQCADAS
jgi:SAM-dependent methyltransferase